MSESIGYLAKSRYVRDLATLVVAYGISINLVEVTWKAKIKAQYPNPNDYSAFMGCAATLRVTASVHRLCRAISMPLLCICNARCCDCRRQPRETLLATARVSRL